MFGAGVTLLVLLATIVVAPGCGGSSYDECRYPSPCPGESPGALGTALPDSGDGACPGGTLGVTCRWNEGVEWVGDDACADPGQLEAMRDACAATLGCTYRTRSESQHLIECGNAARG